MYRADLLDSKFKYIQRSSLGSRAGEAMMISDVIITNSLTTLFSLIHAHYQETAGEDPYLTSAYVTSYVPGLQYSSSFLNENKSEQEELDTTILKVSACCKHFAAYSFENYQDMDRHHFDANVTDQDMTDTFLPAFEACIDPEKGGASCIMCSYNAINGVPSCANAELLHQTRADWNFEGYITSDCGATEDIYSTHHYVDTPEEAVAAALLAGKTCRCALTISVLT